MAVVQRSCVHFAKRCGSVNDVDKLRRRLQRTPERTWRPRRGYHAARGSRRCGLRSLVRCDLDFERQRHVGWRGALAGANPDGGVRDRIFDCGKTRDQYVCQILDTDRRCGATPRAGFWRYRRRKRWHRSARMPIPTRPTRREAAAPARRSRSPGPRPRRTMPYPAQASRSKGDAR